MVVAELVTVLGIVAIVLLIAALHIKGSVALYNRLAGGEDSPSGVPSPSFGKAIGILLITSVLQRAVEKVIELAMGVKLNEEGNEGDVRALAAALLAFAVSVPLMAGVFAWLLPTTFLRGLLVTLCYLAIAIVIGIGIVAIVVAFMLATGADLGGAFG